jgi:anti-anti-sigma factor
LDDEFQLETFLTEGGALRVRVVGELDMATAEAFTDAIAASPDWVNRYVVDLTDCTFLDSSGIRALLICQRRIDDGNGTMQLVGVMPQVERVLRIAGAHQVLQIDGATSPDGSDASDGSDGAHGAE